MEKIWRQSGKRKQQNKKPGIFSRPQKRSERIPGFALPGISISGGPILITLFLQASSSSDSRLESAVQPHRTRQTVCVRSAYSESRCGRRREGRAGSRTALRSSGMHRSNGKNPWFRSKSLVSRCICPARSAAAASGKWRERRWRSISRNIVCPKACRSSKAAFCHEKYVTSVWLPAAFQDPKQSPWYWKPSFGRPVFSPWLRESFPPRSARMRDRSWILRTRVVLGETVSQIF